MRKNRVQVVSSYGRRDTTLVMCARLSYALFAGMALASLGRVIGLLISGEPIERYLPIVIGIGLIGAPASALAELLYSGKAIHDEEKRIRHRLLHEMIAVGAGMSRNERYDSGTMIAMLTDHAERIAEYRQGYWGATKAALIIPFATLAYVALCLDWVIGVLLLLICPLIVIAIGGFQKAFAPASRRSRAKRARLTSQYLDAIANLSTIRLLGAGRRIEERLRRLGEENRTAIMKMMAANQIVIIVVDGLFSLGMICAAVALTLWRISAHAITPAEGMSVIFLMVLLLEPLTQVAGFFYVGMGGRAAEKAVGRYYADVASFACERNAVSDQCTHEESDYAVDVCDVHFDYGRSQVLQGSDLHVKYGEKVAIIGRSGAGKSTLLGLIRNELAPLEGHIMIAGRDVTSMGSRQDQREWVRKYVAYVAQRTWLFTGTIRDNLLMARPDASDEQIWEALEQAHIADEVRSMPDGLDSSTGEQGSLISGGQAQRLSMARAFLSGRPILVLDEPTSQVDLISEQKMIDAIAAIGSEKTVIIVTHRKAILSIADRIVEMVDGQLTSVGKES